MPLALLPDVSFSGPALPEPFVRFELEAALAKAGLLPRAAGAEGRALQEDWERYRRRLRELVAAGGPLRVRNHVVDPLVSRLGYARMEPAGEVQTREGREDGGDLLTSADGVARLRVWSVELEADLDAPARRGAAYRYSHVSSARRVLLAAGERLGLITNGVQLRLLISDPARPDSQVIIPIDPLWKQSRALPDSFRLLLALASPAGVLALPALVDLARLQQARVTRELRAQARRAVEGFVQELLDHPENRAAIAAHADREALARALWREGLVLIYRLLFVLKLESSDDPARAFSFASTSLWRNTFSPSVALAPYARKVLDSGAETGRLLEGGLRALFRLFAEGVRVSELKIEPLGALFGAAAMPTLDGMRWGERAVARLLDNLLWTPAKGREGRERVYYGPLDVEDLGRVYEALLELEPGIAGEPMCRLRRQKLEVVLPIAQGEKYRTDPVGTQRAASTAPDNPDDADDDDDTDAEAPARGKKTKVEWIEEIAPGRFYLRVGLGRKSTGSYYTPHTFVRFLVQETLGPQCDERSPQDNPQPGALIRIRVLDPAMGSGHFLVEACRFLGARLYEACRRCDELATEAEAAALRCSDPAERTALEARAQELRARVRDLPDPDDALERYLPSRAAEGAGEGVSRRIAEAICRRLAAVHCLYGVDKNPLAIELAKLSLWIEAHAEGLPLTFLDHRLVVGDSLTGPFVEHLFRFPGSQKPFADDMFASELRARLGHSLAAALVHVADLEASVGVSLADLEHKRGARARLDAALAPFRLLAAAWAGGVMLGKGGCDDSAYESLAHHIATADALPASFPLSASLRAMIARGLGLRALPDAAQILDDALAMLLAPETWGLTPALPYDLAFPEVFYPTGDIAARGGFDVVLGNPPWEKLRVEKRDVVAALDPRFLSGREVAGIGEEHRVIEAIFASNPSARAYEAEIHEIRQVSSVIILRPQLQKGHDAPASILDTYHLFMIKFQSAISERGSIGIVLGGGFAKSPTENALRKIIFESLSIRYFIHYFNLKQLFLEASSRISFVVVVGDTFCREPEIRGGYNLIEASDLPIDGNVGKLILLDKGKILLKNQSLNSVEFDDLINPSFNNHPYAQLIMEQENIIISEGLHRTENKAHIADLHSVVNGCLDARLPDFQEQILQEGYLCLYGGRSIDCFNPLPIEKSGKWTPQVDLVVDYRSSRLKSQLSAITFFRLSWRNTVGHIATNERSARACILPSGVAAAGSVMLETSPSKRPNSTALLYCSILNSFSFDYQVRKIVQNNFNKAIFAQVRYPSDIRSKDFLAHCALRLNVVHSGFIKLWREQVGDAWREERAALDWPALKGDDVRWAVRAAIDAVVAEAYGLSRAQYAHVLSTFSHKSYPKAPGLCLAAFDELQSLGLEAFTQRHDPYWDIPLNEALPEPVITIDAKWLAKDTNAKGAKGAKLQDSAPVYASPQMALDLGEATAPAQQVIDFAAAAARRGRAKRAAEDTAGYQVSGVSDQASQGEADTRDLSPDTYARLKALLAQQATLTNGDVQAALGIDAATARALLRRLVDEGLARVEGERRGTRYVAVRTGD